MHFGVVFARLVFDGPARLVFDGPKGSLVDFGRHLFICASDGKTDCVSRFGTSILGW